MTNIISNDELLKMACAFDLGPEPIINGRFEWWKIYPKEAKLYHVYVKNMGNPDNGPDRWVITKDSSSCLNKLGEWEYQSLPSNRDDEFYDRCRYSSVHEAINFYRKWKEALEKWVNNIIKNNPNGWCSNPNAKIKNGEFIFNYMDFTEEGLKWQNTK